MRTNLVFFVLLLFGGILQTAFFPRLFGLFEHHSFFSFVAGHTIEFLFLFVVYVGMHRNHWETLIWIFLVSMVANSLGLSWSGASVASFLILGILCTLISPHLLLENGTMVLIFVAIVGLIEAPIHLQLGALLARTPGIFRGVWGFLLVQVLLNALAAPAIFWGLSHLDQDRGMGRRRRKELLL